MGEAGISLVLGPPNAGKLGHVIAWWGELREREPLVVVPTRPAAQAVSLELLRRVGPVVGNRPVLTFDGLVAAVLGRRPMLVGSTERLLVAATLLDGLPLTRLAAVRGLPGAVRGLAALLQELADGGLAVDQVAEVLAGWQGRADTEGLAADVALLHREYVERCRWRGRLERGETAVAAAQAATEWSRPLACYGFASFTPSQRRLLRALSRNAPVLLALVREPGAETAGWAGGSGTEAALWADEADRIWNLDVQPRAFSSRRLARIERLAAGDKEPADLAQPVPLGEDGPLAGVRFLLSAGRRNEVELVAGEIVELLRAGVAPDDVGVLVRHLGPWQEVVQRVFQRAAIPFRLDGETPFSRTGLGHALLSGLRGVAVADRTALLTYLRTPFSGVAAGRVDRLEARLLREPALAGEALMDAVAQALPEVPSEFRAALGLDAGEAGQRARPDVATLRTLAARLLRTAASGASLTSSELEEDARALAALERALEEWDRHHADSPEVDAGLPWTALASVLEQVAVRTGGDEARGVVHVLSVHRARARRWQVVFLLGLVDGEFPGVPERPGLLSHAERRALNRAAPSPLLPDPAAGEERTLYAFALSRAWQLLYLSARNAEDDGAEAIVSPYWTASHEALGAPPLWRSRDLGYVVDLLPVEAVATPGERSEGAGPAPLPPTSERGYLRACAMARRSPAGVPRRLEDLPRWRRPAAPLEHPLTLADLGPREAFSASELESYAQCPFAWFVDRLLRPTSLGLPFDARVQGTVTHQVLAEVYRGLRTEGLLPLDEDRLERAGSLVDHHLDVQLERYASRGDAAERRLAGLEVRQRVLAFLAAEAATQTSMLPSSFEERLGAGEGVDLGGFRLSGRMDRVDTGPADGPVFVIDYKSGSTAYGPTFAAKGALQIPLYLLALRATAPERRLAGGGYVALASEKRRGMVLKEHAPLLGSWLSGKAGVGEDAFEAELAACLDAAREAANGIRAGLIPPEPAVRCPSYCELGPVCRSGRKR